MIPELGKNCPQACNFATRSQPPTLLAVITQEQRVTLEKKAFVPIIEAVKSMAKRVDRRRFIASGVCLIAGCTIDGDSVVPALDPPESLSNVSERQAGSVMAPSNWWSIFDSPKLDALVERALLANPGLRAAQSEASALTNSAIDTGASSGVSGTGSLSLPVASPMSVTLRVAANALPFREISRTRRRAWLRAAESTAAAESLSNSIAIEISRLVMDLDYYLRVKSLMQSSIENSRASVAALQEQFEAGEATRINLLRAQARLSGMLASDAQNQRELLTTRVRMATAIAGRLSDPLIIQLLSGAQVALPQEDYGVAVGIEDLQDRPTVIQQEITYLIRLSELDSAHASLFPALDVSGQITASSGSVSWLFSPSLTLPPLNSVRRAARTDSALDRVYAAMFSWQDALIDAASAVEVAQIQIENEWLRLSRTEAAARALQRAFEEAQNLAETGEITIFSALEAEEEYLDARLVFVGARRDLFHYYISLLSSI